MKRLIQGLFFTLAFIGGFAVASASGGSDALDPDTIDSLMGALSEIVNAAASGEWSLAAILAVVALTAAARKFLPQRWPFWRGDVGGSLLVVLTSFGLALAGALKGGTPFGLDLLWGAFKLAAFSAGGYTLIRRLARLLLAKLPLPSWLARFLAALVGQWKRSEVEVAKAEEAGRAAVEAKPSAGLEDPAELP